MKQIFKYPRTRHIEGSRLQAGDTDLSAVPFSEIAGKHLVVEEKMDGANCGISFNEEGQLQLQSRGHFLTGGPREKHFNRFKAWANTYINELYEILESRYLMYGEWLYAKHTIFYDTLPHYFMEFDIYDMEKGEFLDTPRRLDLYKNYNFIFPVKVLHEGKLEKLPELKAMIGKSHFISNGSLNILKNYFIKNNLKAEQVLDETDQTGLMEGLYIKVEEDGIVTERYKWVRADFLQTALSSGSHWLDRPIIPNGIKKG